MNQLAPKHHFRLLMLLFHLIVINSLNGFSQDPVLVGYWHNWDDVSAPYIPLQMVDERYDVICLSFAIPSGPEDMSMQFVPDGATPSELADQIQWLKDQGKTVAISVGGANAEVNLDDENDREAFVGSMTAMIDYYGFNGLDIDIEHGTSILGTGGSISNPANPAQLNLIASVKEIMGNYYLENGEKLFLTITPETAYVQGGQSSFGGIWGGYLPIVEGLRDSLDILQVQLYNSGTMFGIDGGVYTQGTADFVVAMTEAVIQGFSTSGGFFDGLPEDKVAIGLPACESAAGGGYLQPSEVLAAVQYIKGTGSQPGDYSLTDLTGYPDLAGMMTWSINWDAVENCGEEYGYAQTFEEVFLDPLTALSDGKVGDMQVYPNPAKSFIQIELPDNYTGESVVVTDIAGRKLLSFPYNPGKELPVDGFSPGTYILHVGHRTIKWMKQ